MKIQSRLPAKTLPGLFLLVLLTLSAVLIFSRIVTRKYSTDENQFIASGELLADHRLLPYIDYPYFHVPNLTFVFAAILSLTDYPLLVTRIFSGLCGLLTLTFIALFTHKHFKEHPPWTQYLAFWASIFILLYNPLFYETSGVAWNHDLPILLTLLAIACILRSTAGRRAQIWLFLAGLLIGIAAGTRLTFILVGIPFLAAAIYHPAYKSPKDWWGLILPYGIGMIVSLLPTLIMFMMDPSSFLMGNLEYARLNTLYREATRFNRAMTTLGKALFNLELLLNPLNFLIFSVSMIFAAQFGLGKLRSKSAQRFEALLLLLVFLALVIGAYLPTPVWRHYFYVPLPVAVIIMMLGISSLLRDRPDLRRAINLLLAVIIVISIGLGFGRDRIPLSNLTRTEKWFPMQAHRIGQAIRQNAVEGKILTLSPLYALEGGLDIYPEFVSGPFAWRVAEFVDKKDRLAHSIIGPADLEAFLIADPPAGILIGGYDRLERPIKNVARSLEYQPIQLNATYTLWLPSP